MNDAELKQSIQDLYASVNEAVHYINERSDFFIVKVGAFEIRFDLANLGKPQKQEEQL